MKQNLFVKYFKLNYFEWALISDILLKNNNNNSACVVKCVETFIPLKENVLNIKVIFFKYWS